MLYDRPVTAGTPPFGITDDGEPERAWAENRRPRRGYRDADYAVPEIRPLSHVSAMFVIPIGRPRTTADRPAERCFVSDALLNSSVTTKQASPGGIVNDAFSHC